MQLCPTLCQAPLSMEFSRQEYWSGVPFPPPGDLPDPGIKPASLASHYFKKDLFWEFPGSPWLRFFDLTAKDPGLIPGQGSKIPQALQGNQKYFFNK